MKLLLADDHRLIIDTLRAYWQHEKPEIKLFAASDVAGALGILSQEPVDLALVDLHMPGMNGLLGFETIRKHHPSVPVAIFTGTARTDVVQRALDLGAMGYIPKTLPLSELDRAISQIVKGERFVARGDLGALMPACYHDTVAGGSTGERAARQGVNNHKLTRRENDVLHCLMDGLPNKEIAERLGIKVVTVKLHVRGVCRKLGARNRTQAALIARGMKV